MAKLDMDTTLKYLAYGAGAVVVPAFAGGFVANFAWLNTVLWQTVTVGGIVLASVGAGLVDMLLFSK